MVFPAWPKKICATVRKHTKSCEFGIFFPAVESWQALSLSGGMAPTSLGGWLRVLVAVTLLLLLLLMLMLSPPAHVSIEASKHWSKSHQNLANLDQEIKKAFRFPNPASTERPPNFQVSDPPESKGILSSSLEGRYEERRRLIREGCKRLGVPPQEQTKQVKHCYSKVTTSNTREQAPKHKIAQLLSF